MQLLGYAITAALAFAFAWLLYSAVRSRRYIAKIFKNKINKQSAAAAILIIAFFLGFSILYVHPAEQLYFDENIYQGIALNILHTGNSLWCQYGTGYVNSCANSAIYHDPVGISFFLAIAFAIFGIGINTAYGMSLFVGTASILFVFLLASLIFKDKKAAVATTLVFALMPELFIWSRTQAVPNLLFMLFTIITFLAFLIMRKEKNTYTISAFFASLAITSYMRLEGILLVGIFAFLYVAMQDEQNKRTFFKRIASFLNVIDLDVNLLILFLIFLILIVPEAYFISYQIANPQFGQTNGLFSIAIFRSNVLGVNSNGSCNILGQTFGPNVCYFIGTFNTIGYYPTVFSEYTTALAALGLLILIINSIRKQSEMYNLLLLTLTWIMVYYIFYDFFYAGSVTYGVDVRFMLEIFPPIAILAGVFASELGNLSRLYVGNKKGQRLKETPNAVLFGYSIWALVLIIAVIMPFTMYSSDITILPSQMPQQSDILAAISFFYANYTAVPSNCLVFSYTPDIWYEVNRPSAQIGDLTSPDSNFTLFAKNYSCFVLDVGYWCSISQSTQETCFNFAKPHALKDLSSVSAPQVGQNITFGLYRILNYTP